MTSVEKLAIECVEELAKRATPGDELRRRFRARARQLHSDLYYQGVAYVVAIAAARSEKADVLEKALQLADCKSFIELALGQKAKAEELSYLLYGGMMLAALKKQGVVSSTALADLLKNELLDPRKASLAGSVALKFAEWAKRMAEAMFSQ